MDLRRELCTVAFNSSYLSRFTLCSFTCSSNCIEYSLEHLDLLQRAIRQRRALPNLADVKFKLAEQT